ncbi:MAG: isoprenyl transferase [Bacteroidales bacterium]|nr:isoprenyl transferase [Bacteroidales bacterium]
MHGSNHLLEQIDKNKLPTHVAIIMDGNGRWAKKQGLSRIFGHNKGTESVRNVTEASAELGIPYLTLYAFSTENWNRPQDEVNALMNLLVETINKELPTLNKNNIKLNAIGNLTQLPPKVYEKLTKTINETASNSRLTLTLALSYSSRWEIKDMVQNIAYKIKNNQLQPEDITDQTIQQHLNSYPIPDPDLLIRTSGEYRISNFLLYQLAYTELYFTPTLWPEFTKEDFYYAIIDFQKRERRFGKTTEQINSK